MQGCFCPASYFLRLCFTLHVGQLRFVLPSPRMSFKSFSMMLLLLSLSTEFSSFTFVIPLLVLSADYLHHFSPSLSCELSFFNPFLLVLVSHQITALIISHKCWRERVRSTTVLRNSTVSAHGSSLWLLNKEMLYWVLL